MAAKKVSKRQQKKLDESLDATYNKFKEYEGKKYTGMKIGRSHKWYYDQGVWKETKMTPDEWEFRYAVTKRRAGKAPKGSGVPVGTEYHWYMLGRQQVCKLDANSYTTAFTGIKYKLAHKRADSDKWNISDKAQRKRIIKFLSEMIDNLQHDEITVIQKGKTESKELQTPQKGNTKTKTSNKKQLLTRAGKKELQKKGSLIGLLFPIQRL